jgi:hypothetical protein
MKPDCYYFKQFFEDKPPFCNLYGCMDCGTCKSYISKTDAEANIKEFANKFLDIYRHSDIIKRPIY